VTISVQPLGISELVSGMLAAFHGVEFVDERKTTQPDAVGPLAADQFSVTLLSHAFAVRLVGELGQAPAGSALNASTATVANAIAAAPPRTLCRCFLIRLACFRLGHHARRCGWVKNKKNKR